MLLKKNFNWLNKANNITTICSPINFGFATKMRQGITKNNKDSAGRRLGLKKYGGEEVRENEIIIRQRGFRWKPGENVHFGKDQTLHASKEGIIKFSRDPWSQRRKVFVHVVEQEIPNRKLYPPLPFMYHPELFPELAEKNAKVEPLNINQEIKKKLKFEENYIKLEKKKNQKEITRLERITEDEISFNNFILDLSDKSRTIHKQDYTNKYEIEPILEEIKDISVKYFIPNNESSIRKDIYKLKYSFMAEKSKENSEPEALFTEYDKKYQHDIPRDITKITFPYSYFSEIYAKYANQENIPMALRDLMVEMKKDGMLNPRHDLRFVPLELSRSELEAAVKYESEMIEQELKSKISELKNEIDKINTLKDEDLPYVISQYNANSKESIINLLKNEMKKAENDLDKIGIIDKKVSKVKPKIKKVSRKTIISKKKIKA